MSAVRLDWTPEQAEEQFAFELAAKGIEHERQYRYVPGRQFKSDFAFPSVRLLVEVQGGVYNRKAHGSISGVLRDNERLNLATLHGWSVLRFTPDQVQLGEALTTVEQYLARYEERARTTLLGGPVYDNTSGAPCPGCGLTPRPCHVWPCASEGLVHDPCLGHIDGAWSACCGHGGDVGHVIMDRPELRAALASGTEVG